MNSMRIIVPCKFEGMWVFDDPAVNLVREPYVAGIDQIIDRLVVSISGAEQGFRLLFSATPLSGNNARLEWRREKQEKTLRGHDLPNSRAKAAGNKPDHSRSSPCLK